MNPREKTMHRRDFLRVAGAASAGFALPAISTNAFANPNAADKWRIFEVTTTVEVLKPQGTTHVWLPTPLAQDARYIKSLGNQWSAQGGKIGYSEETRYKAGVVSAEFPEGTAPRLVLVSRFATHDVAVDFSRRGDALGEDRETLRKYTQATELLPTDGVVKDTSSDIVRGVRGGDLEKARAIYEWIVDNTYRDGKVRGCGTGDIKFMLENKAMGGKCADLNALFVALARAEGIPARDVYGIRVANSNLGYKSLGKAGDITKAQHCRAEFYAQGYGWVPVDPADVRKVILEEDGGKKEDDPMVLAARKRLFGSWEMNWLAYNYAHDVPLPGSQRGKIGFLMYPQSETAQGRLDELDPDNFKYTITSKEIV
jgi:transglutaminase-like putative cysteine protease